ncbi:MAG: hypothetical protein VXW91_08865 [Pseudomonadota bacterium]|nr:hypothetical protein [Pseudomonadota bacterium]MEC8664311.1 hypothetical protein [Pseudomonadota bacterium]
MTKPTHIFTAALALLALSGCAVDYTYKDYVTGKGITALSPDAFEHCHGYGCRLINQDSLTAEDRQMLKDLFKHRKDAASERTSIAYSVAYLEQTVGQRLGTDTDIEGTYRQLGDDQHDCVDESVNTTIYLSLMKDLGLLQYHEIGIPSARTIFTSGRLGPHQTAVIKEIETGNKYAVDSWFHDNGARPEIVPMRKWLFGWSP